MLSRQDSFPTYAVEHPSSSGGAGDGHRQREEPFDPLQDADALHAAVNGNRKDVVVDIVCRRSIADVSAIADAFLQKYQQSMPYFIKSHMGGTDKYFLGVVTGCAAGSILEYDVRCLRVAMEGVGRDTDALIEILVGRSDDEIRAIKSAYQQIHGRALEVDLHKELHGSLRHFFEGLMNVERRIATRQLDPEADARALFQAGEGRQGQDESVFIRILTERSQHHLKATFAAYTHLYRSTVDQAILKEFHGDLQKCFHLLVASMYDRIGEVAMMFEKSMKGFGLNEGKLTRLVVRNRDPATRKAIKQVYLQRFSKPLMNRIVKETSGDFQRALLACWGESGL
ncbi:Annexin [Gonapodya prolifera JEL478]|uniref:Annexin n=1 Tax=Gonapodya prolifera (strain JEL478) TaxID=1344416 RepID=A0A139AGT5_GONPJ|nr:Annexin [Gonapodya prolifera JEL478]|eukprot:KXS15997.1 Annexin [Gonapodya prolifera JEL478]